MGATGFLQYVKPRLELCNVGSIGEGAWEEVEMENLGVEIVSERRMDCAHCSSKQCEMNTFTGTLYVYK